MTPREVILAIPCRTKGCNRIYTVEVSRPSQLQGKEMECLACGKTLRVDFNEIQLPRIPTHPPEQDKDMPSTENRAPFSGAGSSLNAILGEYRLGSFRPSSEMLSLRSGMPGTRVRGGTLAEMLNQFRGSLGKIDWASETEVKQYITMVHEAFHLYQDLYLGFPTYYDIATDQACIALLSNLGSIARTGPINYPIDQWSVLLEPAYRKRKLLDCIAKMADHIEGLQFIASPETTKLWVELNCPPSMSQNTRTLMEAIHATSLLEGQAALGTISSIEHFRQDYELTARSQRFLDDLKELYMLEQLPDVYSAPFRLVDVLLPFFGGREDRYYLTMMLADIALHIPPPRVVERLVENGVKKLNFSVGIRFIQAVAVLQDLTDRETAMISAGLKSSLKQLYLTLDNVINTRMGTPAKTETTSLWIEELADGRDNLRYFYRSEALRYLLEHPDTLLLVNPPQSGGFEEVPMILQGVDGVEVKFPALQHGEGRDLLSGEERVKLLQTDLSIKEVDRALAESLYQSGRTLCPMMNRCSAARPACRSSLALEELPDDRRCGLRLRLKAFGIEPRQLSLTFT